MLLRLTRIRRVMVMPLLGLTGVLILLVSNSATSGAAELTSTASAKATVSKYMAPPTSIGFTQKLTKLPTGKTVVVVGGNSPTGVTFESYFTQAGEILGMNVKTITYGSTAESITTAFTQALAVPNVAGIVSYGICPDAYPDQWATIQQRKIPVVGNACGGPWGAGTQKSPLLTTISTQADNARVGGIMADWITQKSKANANTLVVTSSQIPVLSGFLAGVSAQMKNNCASTCPVSSLDVPLSQLATISNQVVSYLQAHPQVNYVFTAFGDIIVGLPQALQAAGLSSKVTLVDGSQTSTTLQYIQAGQLQAEMGWMKHVQAYMTMDAMARAVTGQSTAADSSWKQPFQILVKSNVTNAMVKNGGPEVPGYQQEFKKLWGVS